MNGEVLAESKGIDGEALGFGDEAAFDIEDFEFGGFDELGGELFFETEAVGDGEVLFESDGGGAGADFAFGLKLDTDRGVGESAGGELASLGFGDAEACGLKVRVTGADTSGDGVEGEGLRESGCGQQKAEECEAGRHG